MNLQLLNPLHYPDWDALLSRSQNRYFFHSYSWARVLSDSYKYEPVYIGSFDHGSINFLMPLMDVRSPMRGDRGVSLPFTDYCQPFIPETAALVEAIQWAIDLGKERGWRAIEWRDSAYFDDGVPSSEGFFIHTLNLGRSEKEIYSSLRSNNRRNIRTAERAGLTIEFDRTLNSMNSFYKLHCQTRKRHGLPPQPFAFFRNIFDHIICRGQGHIISAIDSGKAIGSAIFVHSEKEAIFKYGASDASKHSLRPNNLILWEAIKWYRDHNYPTLCLGRTERGNEGLRQYKCSWGADERLLRYFKYDLNRAVFQHDSPTVEVSGFLKSAMRRIPIPLLRSIGRLVYRHIG